MTTYALLFSVDVYNREEIEKMSPQELYDLASVASTVGYDETGVYTLNEFSKLSNDCAISLESSWIYFVTL